MPIDFRPLILDFIAGAIYLTLVLGLIFGIAWLMQRRDRGR